MTPLKVKQGIIMKITFAAKLSVMGKYEKDNEQKFHVMIPREHIDMVRNLKGKQVKVTIEDEL
jgi:hypothetical protein